MARPGRSLLLLFLSPLLSSAASSPGPTRVTIQGEGVTVGQALGEISRQTGILITDRSRLPDRGVRLDLQQVPFWQALDTLAGATGRRVYLYPSNGQITLDRLAEGSRPLPVSYSGRFRCALLKVYASRDLENDRVRYNAAVEIAWEPGLLPLYMESRPQHLQVRAPADRELPALAEGSSLAPVDGALSLLIDVRLPTIPRTSARIAQITGDLTAIAPSRMLTFDFGSLTDLAAADSSRRRQSQQQVHCAISKVVLSRDHWSVRVTVDYPPGGTQLESYQSWVSSNELTLVALDGTRILRSTDYVVESDTARQAVISYHFRDRPGKLRGNAADWKVTYRTPASLVDLPFHFSFRDIPLP